MKSIVLLSGGVDSAVALAHTKPDLAVSFDYGQTHAKELSAAQQIAEHYGVKHQTHTIRLPECPLTGHGDIPEGHAETPDNSFVPGRNIVFIANAVAIAQANGCDTVIVGANADDNAGYPDCRPAFIHNLDEATRSGYGVAVWAPLVRMTKRQIIAHAQQLDVPLHLTWSCYRGGEQPCNQCGACQSLKEATQ